jgi:hypothetical protein
MYFLTTLNIYAYTPPSLLPHSTRHLCAHMLMSLNCLLQSKVTYKTVEKNTPKQHHAQKYGYFQWSEEEVGEGGRK